MLTCPTGNGVGIAGDRDTLQAVEEALRASKVADERVEVRSSREASGDDAGDDAGDDDEHGALASAVRVVKSALGEEAPRLRALNDVLERGEYVVQVEISRDAADDVDDDEKRSVGTALVDAGATEVAFYDTLAVEDLEIRS